MFLFLDLKMREISLVRSVCAKNSFHRLRSSMGKVKFRSCLSLTYSLAKHFHCTKTSAAPAWDVLFYGTDAFSLASLKALNADRLTGDPPSVKRLDIVTKITQSQSAVRKFAEENKLNVFDWPHCPESDRYDVGVVVSFGHLIPHNVIQAFPLGMLNVHASLLPRWRGAAPVANAILNGDTETGVTVMQISPHEFDVGKILLQKSFAMSEEDGNGAAAATTASVTPILAEMGADLLLESLKDLPSLLEKSTTQDSSLATKAPKLKPSQAIVKWDQHSRQYIDRLYRAMYDSIKLETVWHGRRVTLSRMVPPKQMLQMLQMDQMDATSRVSEWPEPSSSLLPGTVLYHKKRKILCVLCADGWVGFKDVFVLGNRARNATDFYNGFVTKTAVDQRHFG